jgi:hypothetical protein
MLPWTACGQLSCEEEKHTHFVKKCYTSFGLLNVLFFQKLMKRTTGTGYYLAVGSNGNENDYFQKFCDLCSLAEISAGSSEHVAAL